VALAESLTPSCGKFFDLLGVREAIDGAGFVRATGNTVWWGAGEPRVEIFANGARGWQATSTALERVMLAEAERAGARVERHALTPKRERRVPLRFAWIAPAARVSSRAPEPVVAWKRATARWRSRPAGTARTAGPCRIPRTR